MLVSDELTVHWALNRVSEKDSIGMSKWCPFLLPFDTSPFLLPKALYPQRGKSSISYEYNTKALTSGSMKMKVRETNALSRVTSSPSHKAPDTPGVYELRYYPGWLDPQNTVYRHSLHVAMATFEATAW